MKLRLFRTVAALALVCASAWIVQVIFAPRFVSGQASPAPLKGDSIAVAHVGLTVSDLDRSIDFFTRAIDFEPMHEREIAGPPVEKLTGVFGMRARVATLRLGRQTIELTEYLTSGGRPVPVDSRSNDRWFQHIAIVTTDMDRAYARLRAHKVKHASTSPQTLPQWNPNAAGIRAFYFHDPDHHVLEIIQFPPGKGDPRWHDAQELFPGIDHTAIVVSDTDASLKFYRDLLGMKVVGGSENHGPEQERLNNVFGARLRITTLHAQMGPGIELLEYLAPRTGRAYPADVAANDLIHWHTSLVIARPDALMASLRGANALKLAGDLVALPPELSDYARGAMIRDPDGHAIQILGDPYPRQAGP